MWYKHKCQFCNKDIKCNSINVGAKKVQLEKHETRCAKNRNLSNANTDYSLTQQDLDNIQNQIIQERNDAIAQSKIIQNQAIAHNKALQNQETLAQLPQVITTYSKIDEENLNLIQNEPVDEIYDSKYYRKQFNNLLACYRWDNGDGLWNIYSMESQYILNNADPSSTVKIYEYKYTTIKTRLTCRITIEVNLNEMTQRLTYRNNIPVTYVRARKVSKIPNNFKQNVKNKIEYFHDPFQNISYSFNRIPIKDINSITIKSSYNNRIDKLTDLIPDNVTIHNIFKIDNPRQSYRYKECLKDLYSHLKYNNETDQFDKVTDEQRCELRSNVIKKRHTDWAIGLEPCDPVVFHGTYDNNIINSICENGFNPSACNTSVYGLGVYFAKEFKYCNNNGFVADLGKNIFHAFVCRIATGSYCLGGKEQKLPEMITESKRFKTFVNSAEFPTIYSVQDPSQIEILYEIHFSNDDKEYQYNYKKMYVPNEVKTPIENS